MPSETAEMLHVAGSLPDCHRQMGGHEQARTIVLGVDTVHLHRSDVPGLFCLGFLLFALMLGVIPSVQSLI